MENIAKKSIDTIRFLSAEAVQKANSGHPGTPMALAPVAYTLWTKHMNHSPANSSWKNRDRFVLSCGHASMLVYSMLHLSGYKVSLEDIKNFRQWESNTPGHPEFGHTDGVETTTGPLGQGIANATGMAIAQEMLASKFNKENFDIVNNHTYAIVSDGDLMEGISHEAASLAGHLKLSKLICFYDDNNITIDGETSLAFSEDMKKRFESYGWDVQVIENGNEDIEKISSSIDAAQKTDTPSLIVLKTTIGYGAPNKQNTAGAHGSPLGDDEIALAKKELGWETTEPFHVSSDVSEHFNTIKESLAKKEQEWNELFSKYKEAHPDLAKEFEEYYSGNLPNGCFDSLPKFEGDESIATRKTSGAVLQELAKSIPNLVQGSADLHPSTNTYFKESSDFQADKREGRNIHYGIREHAMGAIQNGIALYGAHIPLCSTFLVFSDYMRPTIRLAALMKIRSIFVFTHDSVGVGEDGPTHQPIEHVAALRAIPNNVVIRPADGNETAAAWKSAVERKDGPTTIILTRQGVPTQNTKDKADLIGKGAYVLEKCKGEPDIILVGSGSEVHLCTGAKEALEKDGINAQVVSMPSWELLEEQGEEYIEKILPEDVPILSVEAGISMGWDKYADDSIGIEHFGASAPGKVVLEKFGFTVDNVVKRAKGLL